MTSKRDEDKDRKKRRRDRARGRVKIVNNDSTSLDTYLGLNACHISYRRAC